MAHVRRGWLVTALVAALLAVAGEASAQGLTGLRRVSLAVDLQHPIDTLSVEDLLGRLEEGLRQTEPAMSASESATDRLRLTVSVRPVSATILRGYWLPFSGTYGVGPVTLEVERRVTLPGAAPALPGDRLAVGADRRRVPGERHRPRSCGCWTSSIAQWHGARRQAR